MMVVILVMMAMVMMLVVSSTRLAIVVTNQDGVRKIDFPSVASDPLTPTRSYKDLCQDNLITSLG